MGCYRTMLAIGPTIKRLSLSLGITMGLGFAFVPQEGCGGVQPVSDMPDAVAGQLRACVVEHERHVEARNPRVAFEVTLDSDGQVDSIALLDSNLGDVELETCMATAIRSLSVDDIPLRHSENLERDVARPESRNLLGNPALPIAACVASPPCLLTLTLLMGAAVINVQLMVHAATTAKPTTTTTAPPIPIALPRKYPNQTCEEEERIRLNEEMHKVCDKGYAANCNPKNKGLDEIPCSMVKLSILQRQACLAARWVVQNECFGGKPDAVHKKPIDEYERAINNCELLKLKVCAPGHPMANL